LPFAHFFLKNNRPLLPIINLSEAVEPFYAHNDVHSGFGHWLTASNPTQKFKAVKLLLVSGSNKLIN
jgi:hypothetical protein